MGMRRRQSTLVLMSIVLVCAVPASETAEDTVSLPKPQTEGGKPLMQALKERQSMREFSTAELPDQVLSDLLWAAWGVNRPESGKRTAPSAKNMQEVDVYVVTAAGVYLYEAGDHHLRRVASGDLRADTGARGAMASAPVHLLFVADLAKSAGDSEEKKMLYATVTVGCIIQNVYLFCASEGLATVTRASAMAPALLEALELRSDQRVLMAQTVGYPAKSQ